MLDALERKQESNHLLLPFDWRSAFAYVESALPQSLLAPSQRRKLQEFEGPPIRWSWGMVEVRLLPGDRQADVLACALGVSSSHGLNAGRAAVKADSSSAGPQWRESLRPLAGWAAAPHGELTACPMVWLEWDDADTRHTPLAWICVDPTFLLKSRDRASPSEIEGLAKAFEVLDPSRAVEGGPARVRSLAESLPSGARLLAIASLRPRRGRVYRVYAQLPRGSLCQWLRTLRWHGDWAALERWHAASNPEGEPSFCQVEVDRAGLGSYLALELRQTAPGFPEHASRSAWMKAAVHAGIASEDKAAAVLAWPAEQQVELSPGCMARLRRNFHLKLTLGPSGPVAKAYLGFSFRARLER